MDRVGALIGPNGEVKKSIEEKTGVLLNIDSKTGTVELQTTAETADPLSLFRAKAVCEAIGLGFSPPRAFRLFNEEELLKIIDLAALLGRRDNDLARIKGRVIGEGGRARTMIEELTGARVSVYQFLHKKRREQKQAEIEMKAPKAPKPSTGRGPRQDRRSRPRHGAGSEAP